MQFYQGTWSSCSILGRGYEFVSHTNVSQFTGASNSRQLSVRVHANESIFQLFLVYEDTNNDVKMQLASYRPSSSPPWVWQDLTSKLYATLPDYGDVIKYSAPFATMPHDSSMTVLTEKNVNGSYTGTAFVAEYDSAAKNFSIVGKYKSQLFRDRHEQPLTRNTGANFMPFIPTWMENPDILILSVQGPTEEYSYGLWVNDTGLVNFNSTSLPRLVSPFPFARLGGFSPSNSSSFYLYHQLNESAFAEDQWDVTEGIWQSKNFTIPVA